MSQGSGPLLRHDRSMRRRWDIFCAVVDNFGDIGICWRLAQQLADERAADVRLWVDDLAAFARLNPAVSVADDRQQIGLVEVRHWSRDRFDPHVEVPDVVIEAFACELPPTYVEAMSCRQLAPVWINLEYLSAEEWVEGCHQLASPRPQSSLSKYFFFPGFTPQTGGLLRERELLSQRAAFDDHAASEFWTRLGIEPRRDGELRVSLFCYENIALEPLLKVWQSGSEAITVFATSGFATQQCARLLDHPLEPGTKLQQGSLTIYALPFLTQPDYDRLLWSCDVNFVRGEDSFVRAQWAQLPFIWQPYPQSEETHLTKLEAFLERYLQSAAAESPSLGAAISQCWQAWNGRGDIAAAWLEFSNQLPLVERHQMAWVSQLDRLGDLSNNLADFVEQIERRRLVTHHSSAL